MIRFVHYTLCVCVCVCAGKLAPVSIRLRVDGPHPMRRNVETTLQHVRQDGHESGCVMGRAFCLCAVYICQGGLIYQSHRCLLRSVMEIALGIVFYHCFDSITQWLGNGRNYVHCDQIRDCSWDVIEILHVLLHSNWTPDWALDSLQSGFHSSIHFWAF